MLLIDILIYYQVDILIDRFYNRKKLLNSADYKIKIEHEPQCLPPTSY